MKNSGICPKCGGSEIYSNKESYNQEKVVVSAFRDAHIEIFLCINCGYLEEYFSAGSMENEALVEKIRANWNRVAGATQ